VGERVRAVAVVAVVLAVGIFLGSAIAQWTRGSGAPEGEPTGSVRLAPPERVRVEVVNGGGVDGMGAEAMDYLREVGFDVVELGNHPDYLRDGTVRDSSVVLDRVGRPAWARSVAEALDVSRVTQEPDSNLLVDVTVVLGAQWVVPMRPGPRAVEETTPAWWDLRRFLKEGEPAGADGPGEGRMADPGEPGHEERE